MGCGCSGGCGKNKSVLMPGVIVAIAAGVGTAMWVTRDDGHKSADKAVVPVAASADAPTAGGGKESDVKPEMDTAYVLGYTMKSIDGLDQKLADYKGKVVMIVNVASKCGLTPQYKQLEALYQAKKDSGFVILGFPANDFKEQEPGTNAEIKTFCSTEYGVTFPMFEKISVKGETVHPLYKQLAAQPSPVGGEPEWNFTKYLVDRNGKVVAHIHPKVTPEDPALVKQIDDLIAAK